MSIESILGAFADINYIGLRKARLQRSAGRDARCVEGNACYNRKKQRLHLARVHPGAKVDDFLDPLFKTFFEKLEMSMRKTN